MCCCSERGQATLEAAFVLPMLLAVLALFLQPVILLYDRAVMASAASEACRVLETQTASAEAVEAYVLRRLEAVPELAVFHVGGSSGWSIELEGGECSGDVFVTIAHCVEPLPLLGVSAGLVASMQDDGTCSQAVQASGALQPAWAAELSTGPDEWIEAWQ